MQNEPPNAYVKNSYQIANWIAEHQIVRRCSIGLLLFALLWLSACANGQPLVRTETVEVRVPVKPDIPAETLAPCLINRTLSDQPTVGDMAALTEEALIALEKCNLDKAALRRALTDDAAPRSVDEPSTPAP